MKKSTHASKKKREAAIKRRYNRRLKFLGNKGNGAVVDRISQLPDEILISILSRLPLRQAIATSTLSARWRHLYTRIHHLNFPPIILPEIQEEFSKYVNMIDHTLDLFSGNVSLKQFTVNIHQCLEGANLERWLEFALARQVEVIYIHMCYGTQSSFQYALQLSNLIRGRTLPGLRCLKKLFLSGVHVEDQEVELLLSNFPLLERLSLSKSDRLKNVSIVGTGNQGLKLMHLELSYVHNLESIEIRDMINLESFTCYGSDHMYDLRLTNVPKLTDLDICVFGANGLPSIPSCIRDQFRQLQMCGDPTLVFIPPLELKNLKQLELQVHMISGYSNHLLQTLFPLIEACTSLETLRVEFEWIDEGEEKVEIEEIDLHPTRNQLSPYLKKFVLSEYLGSREEMDFALFVMNNAPALEQMIVEPCDATPTEQRMGTARAQKQFRPIAPSSLSLVINPLTRSTS